MTLNAERLSKSKKDIADVAAAVEARDDSNVSREGRLLLAELTALDDAAWDSLLESPVDSELRDQLGFLRQRIAEAKEYLPAGAFSRIRQVGHTASFDISRRSLTIRLLFKTAEDQSLHSSQDLEDTLWTGAAVVTVVSEVMQAMEGTLGPQAQRGCIGEHFEENLKRAEDAVAEIRRIFTAVRGVDALDDSG